MGSVGAVCLTCGWPRSAGAVGPASARPGRARSHAVNAASGTAPLLRRRWQAAADGPRSPHWGTAEGHKWAGG